MPPGLGHATLGENVESMLDPCLHRAHELHEVLEPRVLHQLLVKHLVPANLIVQLILSEDPFRHRAATPFAKHDGPVWCRKRAPTCSNFSITLLCFMFPALLQAPESKQVLSFFQDTVFQAPGSKCTLINILGDRRILTSFGSGFATTDPHRPNGSPELILC